MINCDVAVLGSTHLDIAANVMVYPKYGNTVNARNISLRPGGKGSNQAVTVAKLGGKVALISGVGQDTAGDQELQNLKNNHVMTDFVKRFRNEPTGTFDAIVDHTGENTMVGTPGGADSALAGPYVTNALKHINAPVMLLQMETSKASIVAALKEARAKGMYIILDPADAEDYFNGVIKYADCAMPNTQETKRITGVTVNNLESAKRAAKVLADKGARTADVKMGGNGNMVYQKATDKFTYIPAEHVKAIDTVGAGDTYAGAAAIYYSKHHDHHNIMDALRFASHVAAIKVSRAGGQKAIPTLSEV